MTHRASSVAVTRYPKTWPAEVFIAFTFTVSLFVEIDKMDIDVAADLDFAHYVLKVHWLLYHVIQDARL